MDDVHFVYFDLDDTLLDHAEAERKALADVRDRYSTIFGAVSVAELQETYHEINAPLWRKYADGTIDKERVQRERFDRLLDALDASHADSASVGRYYMQRYGEHWTFIPGARGTFELISDRVPVGVMTNGFAEVQSKKLDAFPVLRERSDAIVICEDVGVLKPDPKVFEHATQEAGVAPEDVLYVGDSYRSDVAGAESTDWSVAWYAPEGTNGRSLGEDAFAFSDWDQFQERFL